jgi:hypothetical protein
MERYQSPRIAEAGELDGLSLPGEVQLALDDLAGSVREGLLALSVGVGLMVLDELLEEELVALVGAKGRHDPERSANRHGSRAGRVVLGGRKNRGPSAAGAHARGPRAGASHLRPLRLRRPALRADGRDDAGRALDPPPPGRARADRHARPLGLEVGRLAPLRRPYPPGARRAAPGLCPTTCSC